MRALALAVLLVVAAPAQERPLPDFNTFAAEVKKHLATDEERQSGYVFNERRLEQKVNAEGRVTGESVKVYEVYPGLPGEDRYRRLIEEDGRPTPPERLARLDAERRKEGRGVRAKAGGCLRASEGGAGADQGPPGILSRGRRHLPRLRHSDAAA